MHGSPSSTPRGRAPSARWGGGDTLASSANAGGVVTDRGVGVAASGVAFAPHLLGHRRVTVCDGCLIRWPADRRIPLGVGDEHPLAG
jgi:hypothetical protein